jgi:hypothetical protein
LAISILAVGACATLAAADFAPLLEFPVTDERARMEAPLGRDLVLRIGRAKDSEGRLMGWDFNAVDRRLAQSPNFFYECLCGHGPRPHDLYAWHFVEKYYEGDRVLPVYGYPIEVRVRCLDCEVAGTGAAAHFVSGTVEVGWRRLSESNPRQLRIAELRR